MALSINREIGITPQNNLFAPKPADTVQGDELTSLAREILSTSTRKTSFNANNINANTPEVKIFTQGADVGTVRQAATNLTGYDVVISPNAQQAINALKAQAAQNFVNNMPKIMDGNIHFNAERPDPTERKFVFDSSNPHGIFVSESANTDKDKKGSGGFYVPFEKENKGDKKEGINLVI